MNGKKRHKTTTSAPKSVGKCPLWRAPCSEGYCMWWREDAGACVITVLADQSVAKLASDDGKGEVQLREAHGR